MILVWAIIIFLILLEIPFWRRTLGKRIRWLGPSCGKLNTPENGMIANREDDKEFSVTTFDCHDGYRMIGIEKLTCVFNENYLVWNSHPPVCELIKCVSLSDLPDGKVVVTGLTIGGKSQFSCNDDDHELIGEKELICEKYPDFKGLARWHKDIPVCKRKQCPELKLTSKLKASKRQRNTRDVVQFSCDPGFVLEGNNEVQCQEDKTWNNVLPVCKEMQCPKLENPANGIISNLDKAKFTINEILTVTCNSGFKMVGSNEIICKDSATWSVELPKCIFEEKDCAKIKSIENGKLTTESRKAVFTCNDGFTLRGAKELTCSADGKWSADSPKCVKKESEKKTSEKKTSEKKES